MRGPDRAVGPTFTQLIPAAAAGAPEDDLSLDTLSSQFRIGMGYTIGYDVAADLKIVQWPTTFLTRLESFAVGRVIPEKNLPHGRSRSDPTILQYSVLESRFLEFLRISSCTSCPTGTYAQKKQSPLDL